MHIISENKGIHTDLLIDFCVDHSSIKEESGVQLFHAKYKNHHYSTIGFLDSTDKDQKSIIVKFLVEELKKYVTNNSSILIVGLGNRNSTPDSLGPKCLDRILVTRHLFSFGDVEEGYSNVSIFEPNVFGSTGINSVDLIKSVVDLVHPDIVFFIDSLCTSSVERMNHSIQITDSGISPGSGVLNDRGELSSNTLGCNVIAIGIPTVVDIRSMVTDLENADFIVTSKDVDYVMDSFSYLIGESINKVLHKSYLSTK